MITKKMATGGGGGGGGERKNVLVFIYAMWMDVDSNDLPQTLGLHGFIVIYGDLW